MYGAFIGDIVGSKYEFNNIKTKNFPLFSRGCDYTDDTIMTVAVAKAIMLGRQEQYRKNGNGKGFQEFLIEVMQDFGRRYPNPTGAYGVKFAKWLRQENPRPYGSYGNGAAMRVSPCGLAAVTLEEAQALARASACVSHDHPEGVKGAETVSTAVFLAKIGETKEKIRQFICEHYYNLNFTLDSIRDSYRFDGSCQGSVPQAIVAFLESNNFEDALRNVISSAETVIPQEQSPVLLPGFTMLFRAGVTPAGYMIKSIQLCWKSKQRQSHIFRKNLWILQMNFMSCAGAELEPMGVLAAVLQS